MFEGEKITKNNQSGEIWFNLIHKFGQYSWLRNPFYLIVGNRSTLTQRAVSFSVFTYYSLYTESNLNTWNEFEPQDDSSCSCLKEAKPLVAGCRRK